MTSQYNPISMPEFDVSKAPAMAMTIIAKLAFNGFVHAADEYMKARGGGAPIPQWRQEFHAANRIHPDGTPGIYGNSLNLTSKDGRPLGEGSAYDVVYKAFAKIGLPQVDPNNPQSQLLLNHWFTLDSHTIKLGTFEKRVWLPVQYHGDACPPIPADQVQTITPRDSASPAAGGTGVPAATPSAPTDDNAVAKKVASILDGKKREEAVITLMSSELRTVTTLFALPFLPGFVPTEYPTLNLLIEKGYITDDGVVLHDAKKEG